MDMSSLCDLVLGSSLSTSSHKTMSSHRIKIGFAWCWIASLWEIGHMSPWRLACKQSFTHGVDEVFQFVTDDVKCGESMRPQLQHLPCCTWILSLRDRVPWNKAYPRGLIARKPWGLDVRIRSQHLKSGEPMSCGSRSLSKHRTWFMIWIVVFACSLRPLFPHLLRTQRSCSHCDEICLA